MAKPSPQRALEMRQALMQRGLAERSARLYTNELWRIEQWLAPRRWTLATVTPEVLASYVNTRPHTWATRKLTRAALRHGWEIIGRDNPPLWAVRVPRKPRGRCRALEPDEAKRLATVARQRGDLPGLAVLFGLYVGLRRDEISAVRWEDITVDNWLRIMGKFDQPAQLPLHPALIVALGKVPRTGRCVFPGQGQREHVHGMTVWNWVREVGAAAGLEHLAPHVLRHTCLATANDNTGDLRATQELARHARPETTALYTRVTSQRLMAAVNALDF